MTGGSERVRNTADGNNALDANTTGNNNTAIGNTFCLGANTTGTRGYLFGAPRCTF